MPTNSPASVPGRKGSIRPSEEHDPPKVTQDICPDGNLIVVVDETDFKVFRVSAEHLALASGPFKALLSPRFIEGSSRPKDKSTSWVVRLREDNGNAMHVLFGILHHDRGNATIVDLAQLKEFAVVIDKYDCSWPVRKWTREWTANNFPLIPYSTPWSLSQAGDELDLLCLTFTFQDHSRFYEASQRVMFHASNDRVAACQSKSSEALTAILPTGLLRALNKHRKTILQRLHLGVEEIISSYVEHTPGCGNGSARTELACGTMDHLGRFLRQLHHYGLWPLARRFEDTAISDLVDILASFDTESNAMGVGSGCGCIVVNLAGSVRSLAGRPRNKVKGLCLTCVKAGKFSAKAGNCCGANTHSDTPAVVQDGEESEDEDSSDEDDA